MNKKRWLSLALSAALTLSLSVPAFAVENGHGPVEGANSTYIPTVEEAQTYVTEKGWMTGTDKGFEPEGTVTRATMYEMLWKMEGSPVVEAPTETSAQETEEASGILNAWWTGSARWAYQEGLTTGVEGGRYEGERVITKAEVITILYRYMKDYKDQDVSLEGDWSLEVFEDAAKVQDWAKDAMLWAWISGVACQEDTDPTIDPDVQVKRAELAQMLTVMGGRLYTTVSLEDYLASGGQEWFVTGKTEYTVQAMMVSKEISFHNELEVTDYTVTDDGVSVVLKGTLGEQWVSKLEKVAKTYTTADGQPITENTFAQKDTFVDLKTVSELGTNFAMFVPNGTSVTVNTAWGDVLHTNLPNAPHGEGDYLVCRVGEDGQPDLSDVWVVNGAQFPNTYDMSNKPVERNVLVLVPNPNDGSYFEAAVNGAKALEDKFPGTKTEVQAMGTVTAAGGMPTPEEELNAFKGFFLDAAESGKYDLIITGGAECTPSMLLAAKAYPNQKFFSFDLQHLDGTELETTSYENVYGVIYKNEDLGYLAGYIASQITTSDMEKANADKKVGVLVGMDVPGMNDYVGSFCQVCQENGVTVYLDYVGDFVAEMAPVAAEKAKAMYDDGVDVIWQVAGGAGKGVFTAAAEADRYALGVDCDQTLTVSDEKEKASIVTSFYANSAAAIEDAYQALVDGKYPGGTYPTVGLAEGYVGFADNAQFEAMAPQAIRDSVTALYEKMADGTTEVFKASANTEAWETLKAAVAPAQ